MDAGHTERVVASLTSADDAAYFARLLEMARAVLDRSA